MGKYRLTRHGLYGVLVIAMYRYDPDEDISVWGFPTLELATEYAKRRTRDSLEELRSSAQSQEELRKQWYTFGEDCLVIGGAYKGAAEGDYFFKHPATSEERDWQAIEKLVSEGGTASQGTHSGVAPGETI